MEENSEPNSTENHEYSAQDVADAFVRQYYKILQESPQDSHGFYKDNSILARPCPINSMKSSTTLKDIANEIMAFNIKDWSPNLTTVHAQDSVMGSVVVGVTGSLTDNDNVTKNFAQSFCLAPQEGGGFYVHNDILHILEIKNVLEPSPPVDNAVVDNAVAATATPQIVPQTIHKAKGSTKKDKSKVASSSKEKSPVPTETNKKSESESVNGQEDANRVSYASIVSKEGPIVAPPTPQTSVTVTTVPKQSVTVPVKPVSRPTDEILDGKYDVNSIIVKDLPAKMTEETLLEVVKKQFGPVKNKNIQIKEYSEDGYRYAFVEFESPKSARTAVEARFIEFEDRDSEIQYKRSTQGGYNYMGRTGPGRGGFRNDNFYGRDGSWGRNGGDNEYNNYRRNNNNNNRFF